MNALKAVNECFIGKLRALTPFALSSSLRHASAFISFTAELGTADAQIPRDIASKLQMQCYKLKQFYTTPNATHGV